VLLLRRMPRYCRPADARGTAGRDFDDFAEFQHYRWGRTLRLVTKRCLMNPIDASARLHCVLVPELCILDTEALSLSFLMAVPRFRPRAAWQAQCRDFLSSPEWEPARASAPATAAGAHQATDCNSLSLIGCHPSCFRTKRGICVGDVSPSALIWRVLLPLPRRQALNPEWRRLSLDGRCCRCRRAWRPRWWESPQGDPSRQTPKP
jgi:hypothetical protein